MAQIIEGIRAAVRGYAYPIAGVFFVEFYDITNLISFIFLITMLSSTSICCCACHHNGKKKKNDVHELKEKLLPGLDVNELGNNLLPESNQPVSGAMSGHIQTYDNWSIVN